MAYTKLNLTNGTKVDASHFSHIEQGIFDAAAMAEAALSESELSTAVGAALAQAKASGEFDGAPGDPGEPGSDGVGIKSVTQTTTSSADGGTNVVTVTKTDGTTSTFNVKNGSKGSPGDPGYTPVKGTDYWTEADKASIVQEVNADTSQLIASELASRGQLKPEFANSIDECEDTTKLYVLPDGYIYGYMAYVTEGETVPNFTNLMDDPNAYIKTGVRYSQSGAAWKTYTAGDSIVVPVNLLAEQTLSV